MFQIKTDIVPVRLRSRALWAWVVTVELWEQPETPHPTIFEVKGFGGSLEEGQAEMTAAARTAEVKFAAMGYERRT